ncbi:glyoxalase-like domain-containing protein [Elsinoe ampelina]|uniref:Glyoxalase-like domain-containing protein n=1 Tax=Elsinoe ampelina TaxID=302913 RepID=A0A6A6G484_9PEZI|nr:glyoxalase-like domain-containing protein [Elsinoe ampelina]
MAPEIDHIIVGLPYSDLQSLPTWLTNNFTIAPGGRHADGKTENKLIVFKDGSYIELIAFINDEPENRKGHWWGQHGSGYIDWAFTSDSAEDIHEVNERINHADTGLEGVKYQDPRAGGRIKPDGVEIKWKVTFPENVRRGEVPFWCHDVTPRELRVPKDEKLTSHPSGVLGVEQLDLVVPANKLDPFKKFYSALMNSEGDATGDSVTWGVGAVNKHEAVYSPKVRINADKAQDGKHAAIAKLTLLTDTKGEGESRKPLVEKLGGVEMRMEFTHGRQ